jgi:hypothetical protein
LVEFQSYSYEKTKDGKLSRFNTCETKLTA